MKKLLLATLAAVALSAPVYAADGHGHEAGKGHAHEESAAHADGHGHHDEKPHFNIAKPETEAAAWALIEETVVSAEKAIAAVDANALHESSEKLEVAVEALHGFAGKDNAKLTQALEQLSKSVDRFHHAAEDKDTAGATESLDFIKAQKDLVKTLSKPAVTNSPE